MKILSKFRSMTLALVVVTVFGTGTTSTLAQGIDPLVIDLGTKSTAFESSSVEDDVNGTFFNQTDTYFDEDNDIITLDDDDGSFAPVEIELGTFMETIKNRGQGNKSCNFIYIFFHTWGLQKPLQK